MPRRQTPLIPDHYYHIYNRGHNRSNIFFDEDNYHFFLRRLREYVAGEHARIIAYVLMPNHYHLLVEILSNQFSHALQKLSISYTKAINQRRHRSGSLFQGAYKSIIIENDTYLLHLSCYIHLNPVQAGLVKRPHEWKYSSYPEYIGLRKGSLPQIDQILGEFASPPIVPRMYRLYREFVEDGIEDTDQTISHLVLE